MAEINLCHNCQNEIASGSLFCPFCGAQVQITKNATENNYKKILSKGKYKHRTAILTLSAILFIFFIYLLYSFFLKNIKPDQVLPEKAKNSSEVLKYPSDVIRKVIVQCSGNSIEYTMLIRQDRKNKKFLSLWRQYRIYSTLNYQFSNNTRLYNFRTVCEKSNINYILFKADDPEWFVKYMWDITSKNLFFIARQRTSNKIYNSKNLKSNSKAEKLLKKF